MFNKTNQAVVVDIKSPCVGTLQKSHPKSYFYRCHVRSQFFENRVDKSPLVLQIMLFGDEEALVEILPEEVYDEWIKSLEKQE